jgi:hypothetical protein
MVVVAGKGLIERESVCRVADDSQAGEVSFEHRDLIAFRGNAEASAGNL